MLIVVANIGCLRCTSKFFLRFFQLFANKCPKHGIQHLFGIQTARLFLLGVYCGYVRTEISKIEYLPNILHFFLQLFGRCLIFVYICNRYGYNYKILIL